MIKKVKSINNIDMEKECDYYQSTIFHCNCGEVAMESSMYQTQMLCSHMLYRYIQKGIKIEEVEFPKFPRIKIQYNTNNNLIENKINIPFNFMNGEKQMQDYMEEMICLLNMQLEL